MSITDELREWAEGDTLRAGMSLRTAREQALDIADRIDQAHESAMYDMRREHDEWVADRDAKWVTLPLDADGEVIHVGDVIEAGVETFRVGRMLLTRWGWEIDSGKYTQLEMRHHHEPTVEDVLCELLDKVDDDRAGQAEIIAEYAAKLRLAKESE